MRTMKIKTADEIYNIVILAFQQACTALSLNSGIVKLDNDKSLDYTTEVTAHDYLSDYLRDRYCPKSGHFGDMDKMSIKVLSDTFVRCPSKIAYATFEFDRNELTYNIHVLLDRIGLMYSCGIACEADVQTYIYLKIKEQLGYLMQFFEILKDNSDMRCAFGEFCKWNSAGIDNVNKYLDTIHNGMSYAEYFDAVKKYNFAMQPIYDLAQIDVDELTFLQLRVRDGLMVSRRSVMKGEN